MSEDWKSGLPEILVEAPFFKAAPSLEEAVQQITDSAKYQGQSIKLPGEEDDLGEFRERLGEKVPGLFEGTPEQYAFPEDTDPREDLVAEAKAVGLSQSQFDAMLQMVTSKEAQHSEWLESQQQLLADEWGHDVKDRLAEVLHLAETTGAPESLINTLANREIDAATAMWLHSLVELGDPTTEIHSQDSEHGFEVGELEAIDAKLTGGQVTPGSPEYQRLLERKVAILGRAA